METRESDERDSGEPTLRLQIILGLGLPIIAIGGGVLAIQIADILGFRVGEISLLATFRVLMIFTYPIIVVPCALLGEYWWSQTRKKPFKPNHVAVTMVLLGAVLMFMAFLSFAFETLFSGLDFIAQVEVLGGSVAITILVTALTARTGRIRERVKNIYD